MKNRLNENHQYSIVIAAVVSALIVMIAGLATGLTCAVQKRHQQAQPPAGNNMAQYLLEESAYSLKSSMSALRLCNESEPADELNRTALVFAVRAETALECHYDDWADSRQKEAFLNDIATILHSYEPLETVKLSDKLYEYSSKFYDSIVGGTDFAYNGELIDNRDDEQEPDAEITEEDIAAAKELVDTALHTTRSEYVGAWSGNIEFYVESGERTGYAIVCGGKITEYSFIRGEEGDDDTDESVASEKALAAAKACGYDDLVVGWAGRVGSSIAVIMCRDYNGALAIDDYASAVVFGGEVVSFSAGRCETEHKDIPQAKKTESEASRSAVGGGEGKLVVRTVNGKERICYQFRYELDDGVHYVYVCAENGKQMQVL